MLLLLGSKIGRNISVHFVAFGNSYFFRLECYYLPGTVVGDVVRGLGVVINVVVIVVFIKNE